MAGQSPPHPLQEDFENFFANALCGFLTTNTKGEILRGNSRLAKWLGGEDPTDTGEPSPPA